MFVLMGFVDGDGLLACVSGVEVPFELSMEGGIRSWKLWRRLGSEVENEVKRDFSCFGRLELPELACIGNVRER